jgi:nitroreductase
LDSLITVGAARSPGAPFVQAAIDARDALTEWNTSGAIDGSVAPLSTTLSDRGCEDPDRFFSGRHSVRHFAPTAVDPDLVNRALELAIHSPSVCNRQPWRVRLYTGCEISRILKHQNGNTGFADNIPLLALISVEIGYFCGPGERNQAWIEGGIFSSSLVWALHSVRLESCMLNLSIANKAGDALRRDSGMPSSEIPIMMIAIGHGAHGHRVARSRRRTLDEVIVNNVNEVALPESS